MYLPVDSWARAFLIIGVLYAITSSFTLAKCVRDQHDTQSVINRVDEARLDKFIAEHDTIPCGASSGDLGAESLRSETVRVQKHD